MTKGYCMIFSSPSYMLVVALYWSCRTWKCLKIGVRYRYLNNNYFLHRSGNCWKLALLLMARRHFAARHFAPKDKMPQDKMPQGHFAPRHFAPKDKMPQDEMPQGHFAPGQFAPNHTKFWKGDILPQLQNYGGHFAPIFLHISLAYLGQILSISWAYLGYISSISWAYFSVQ